MILMIFDYQMIKFRALHSERKNFAAIERLTAPVWQSARRSGGIISNRPKKCRYRPTMPPQIVPLRALQETQISNLTVDLLYAIYHVQSHHRHKCNLPFTTLTLFVGWQERHPKCKSVATHTQQCSNIHFWRTGPNLK